MDAKINNEYLKSPSSKKHYIIFEVEFGLYHFGEVSVIFRSLMVGNPVYMILGNTLGFLQLTQVSPHANHILIFIYGLKKMTTDLPTGNEY